MLINPNWEKISLMKTEESYIYLIDYVLVIFMVPVFCKHYGVHLHNASAKWKSLISVLQVEDRA